MKSNLKCGYMKKLRYLAEAALVQCFLWLFTLLGVERASAVGGYIARMLGPWLRVSQVARRNLAQALPDITPQERERIVVGMWDNLGRVVAEFPHLHRPSTRFLERYVTVTGLEHLQAVPGYTEGAILFSGHIGNWEILPKLAAAEQVPLSFIYRPANNPVVDRLIQRLRGQSGIHLFAKGTQGAKEAFSVLKKGGALGMLVDQKMNNGIAVPFFGRDAMTTPALAKLSLRFGSVVIPARVKRLEGVRFLLEISPPLTIAGTNYQVMREVNTVLEAWITDAPEQWFWVHKRWPKA